MVGGEERLPKEEGTEGSLSELGWRWASVLFKDAGVCGDSSRVESCCSVSEA